MTSKEFAEKHKGRKAFGETYVGIITGLSEIEGQVQIKTVHAGHCYIALSKLTLVPEAAPAGAPDLHKVADEAYRFLCGLSFNYDKKVQREVRDLTTRLAAALRPGEEVK